MLFRLLFLSSFSFDDEPLMSVAASVGAVGLTLVDLLDGAMLAMLVESLDVS